MPNHRLEPDGVSIQDFLNGKVVITGEQGQITGYLTWVELKDDTLKILLRQTRIERDGESDRFEDPFERTFSVAGANSMMFEHELHVNLSFRRKDVNTWASIRFSPPLSL